MDALELVAALVDAVAWPLVVLVALLLLRQPLGRALNERVTKIKGAGFEVELERAYVKTEAAVVAAGTQAGLAEELPSDVDGLADRDPRRAVLTAYELVVRVLREQLTAAGARVDLPETASAAQLGAVAAQAGVITRQSAESVQGLTVLRNLVVHGPERDLTPAQAREYVAMAAATIYSFRQPGTPPARQDE